MQGKPGNTLVPKAGLVRVYKEASLTLTYVFPNFNPAKWERCTKTAWEVKSKKGKDVQ